MKNQIVLILLGCFICLAARTDAQNCATGAEVTAPAGGTVAAATNLTVYNSQEAGPDGATTRATVDTYDAAWRAGVSAVNSTAVFNTWSDTTTPQGNVAVPVNNAFLISGVNVTFDYRDFPLDYRTVAAPCIGSTITTVAERVALFAKTATMQGGENAPRPARLYNSANQPIVYDEIQDSAQPNRGATANAVLFTFSTPVKAFGAWFGDTETRTDGTGDPALVRFLDASGNRIGSDVLIQPTTGSQAGCGGSVAGCGNQTTRWIGFLDTNASVRVKQMVVVVGFHGGTSSLGHQRLSFVGPTIPSFASASSTTVSGHVRTARGNGIRNAWVTLQSSNGGYLQTVYTGIFGSYEFTDVPVGETYFLTVSSKRFSFVPNTRVITVLDELPNEDFTAQ